MKTSLFIAGFFGASLVCGGLAAAADPDLVVRLGEQGLLVKEVRSFKALRQEGVVIQQLDYSCGAAAVSTLLNFHFMDPVQEQEVVGFIFIHGQTPEEGLRKYLRRQGFSLLDIKRFVEFRGYKSAGYKSMELSDLVEFLEQERVPVLVPINPLGYHHFVVLRAIAGNRVYLADPAVGKTTMSIARFLDLWVDGIGFVVTKKPPVQVSWKMIRSDSELEEITAAGVAAPTASGARAATRLSRSAPSGQAPGPAPGPSLLSIGAEEAAPDIPRLRPTIEREIISELPRYQQTVADFQGVDLMTIFYLQNYSPGIQFGRPNGNFIDFTPPSGGQIIVRE